MRTVYFPFPDILVEDMFKSEGWTVTKYPSTTTDLFQFVGGPDVNPAFYNQHKHPTTAFDPHRDLLDFGAWKIAKTLGIPCAGICRGSQFLHVMLGGELFQNIDKHAISGTHDCVNMLDGTVFQVTSTHHQIVKPNSTIKVLFASNLARRLERMSHIADAPKSFSTHLPTTMTTPIDVEGWHIPYKNVGGMQCHPEYTDGKEAKAIYFSFLEKYILKPEKK